MASRLLFDFIGPHFLCPAFSRSLAAVSSFPLQFSLFLFLRAVTPASFAFPIGPLFRRPGQLFTVLGFHDGSLAVACWAHGSPGYMLCMKSRRHQGWHYVPGIKVSKWQFEFIAQVAKCDFYWYWYSLDFPLAIVWQATNLRERHGLSTDLQTSCHPNKYMQIL